MKFVLQKSPRSEMKIDATSDYVTFFCGLKCYDKWRKGNTQDGE